MGDLYRTYLISKRDRVGFNLAYIGPDFKHPHKQEFDREYMTALFNYAKALSIAGYPWAHSPPGYDLPVNDAVNRQAAVEQQLLKNDKTVTP